MPKGLGSPNPLQAMRDITATSMQVRTEEIIPTQFIRQSKTLQITLSPPDFRFIFGYMWDRSI